MSIPLRLLAVAVVAGGIAAAAQSASLAAANSVTPGVQVIAAAPAGNAANGKKLFAANCAACHGATGVEGGVGPSLKGEKAKKDAAATIAWIKKPLPPMPKLYPSPLSDKDVADVSAYVQTL